MAWWVLSAMAFSLFLVMVFFFKKFVGYMKKEQNLVIEPLKDSLIDKDNPVGLSPEELQKLKQQQQEAQEHLREVISRIPVIQKDGRFQVDQEALRQRKEAAARGEESPEPTSNGTAAQNK